MKSLVFIALAALFSLSAVAADDPSIKGQLREDIQATMKQHVEDQQLNGKYVLYDPIDGKLLRLTLDNVHSGIVKKGDFYVSCADFTDAKGTLYDLDFMVAETNGELRVLQALVHKAGSDKRKYHVEKVDTDS